MRFLPPRLKSGGNIVKCPHCSHYCPMVHLHDLAHGIEGTHMAGSERFLCSSCDHPLSREQAEARGLIYTLDKEPT